MSWQADVLQPISPVTIAGFALSLNPNVPDRYTGLWSAVYIPSIFFYLFLLWQFRSFKATTCL